MGQAACLAGVRAPSVPISSGQTRCQSFGRKSQRMTSPAVARSISTHRSALTGLPEAHCVTSDPLTFKDSAKVVTLPRC